MEVSLMAIYFKMEGPQKELENRAYSYSEIKTMLNGGNLGGYTLSINPFLYIFCDDDGLSKDLEINSPFRAYMASNVFDPHFVVGPVIAFTSRVDMLIFDGQLDPKTGESLEG